MAAALGWRLSGRGLRAALERPQAILELAVAILQLLVLAGELAQLVLQPLDPHLGIIVRLTGAKTGEQKESSAAIATVPVKTLESG